MITFAAKPAMFVAITLMFVTIALGAAALILAFLGYHELSVISIASAIILDLFNLFLLNEISIYAEEQSDEQ